MLMINVKDGNILGSSMKSLYLAENKLCTCVNEIIYARIFGDSRDSCFSNLCSNILLSGLSIFNTKVGTK